VESEARGRISREASLALMAFLSCVKASSCPGSTVFTAVPIEQTHHHLRREDAGQVVRAELPGCLSDLSNRTQDAVRGESPPIAAMDERTEPARGE